MKTKQEIEAQIKKIESDYSHILTGSLATVSVNAPRALGQVNAAARLMSLHWVLGTEYKSKLKGVNT